MNNWIKTSDRLPETGKRVLIFVQEHIESRLHKVIFVGCYIAPKTVDAEDFLDTQEESFDDLSEFDEKDNKYYVLENWFCSIEEYGMLSAIDKKFVTHWQPLPEFPNEDK